MSDSRRDHFLDHSSHDKDRRGSSLPFFPLFTPPGEREVTTTKKVEGNFLKKKRSPVWKGKLVRRGRKVFFSVREQKKEFLLSGHFFLSATPFLLTRQGKEGEWVRERERSE